jgi:hypothetical protein
MGYLINRIEHYPSQELTEHEVEHNRSVLQACVVSSETMVSTVFATGVFQNPPGRIVFFA